MGSCAAPSAKGDDKFITTDYLQQCPKNNLIIQLLVHPAPPVFDTKHASQTGNFAYPHLTARDFPIR
ncbi:hypothetical protein, partial [Enterobacter cloacae]|uniref:hypothetical protein n=1 Tax=Enterobacter cloacae TaxID=550 RepID=UPI001F32760A